MNTFPRWSVLILLMAAAIACYIVGFIPGFSLFLAIGLLLELAFWIKFFKSKKPTR